MAIKNKNNIPQLYSINGHSNNGNKRHLCVRKCKEPYSVFKGEVGHYFWSMLGQRD